MARVRLCDRGWVSMGGIFGGGKGGGMKVEGLQCIGRWLGESRLCRRGGLERWWKEDQMGEYILG